MAQLAQSGVRRLITQLSYPELVLNLEMAVPQLPSKRYPPWVCTAQSKTNLS